MIDAQSRYPVGYTQTMYIDKDTYACLSEKTVKSLAIVGVVFFSICALIVSIFLIVVINYFRSDIAGFFRRYYALCRNSCTHERYTPIINANETNPPSYCTLYTK